MQRYAVATTLSTLYGERVTVDVFVWARSAEHARDFVGERLRDIRVVGRARQVEQVSGRHDLVAF